MVSSRIFLQDTEVRTGEDGNESISSKAFHLDKKKNKQNTHLFYSLFLTVGILPQG